MDAPEQRLLSFGGVFDPMCPARFKVQVDMRLMRLLSILEMNALLLLAALDFLHSTFPATTVHQLC